MIQQIKGVLFLIVVLFLFAICPSFLSAQQTEHVLQNNILKLTLVEDQTTKNLFPRAFESLRPGNQFSLGFYETAYLWRIRAKDFRDGSKTFIDPSTTFTSMIVQKPSSTTLKGIWVVTIDEQNSFLIEATIALPDGSETVHWGMSITPLGVSDVSLFTVDYPRVQPKKFVPEALHCAVIMMWGGSIYCNVETLPPTVAMFLRGDGQEYDLFPGYDSAQFTGYFTHGLPGGDRGFSYWIDDTQAYSKRILTGHESGNIVYYTENIPVNNNRAGNSFVMPYAVRMGLPPGNWEGIAGEYRRWSHSSAGLGRTPVLQNANLNIVSKVPMRFHGRFGGDATQPIPKDFSQDIFDWKQRFRINDKKTLSHFFKWHGDGGDLPAGCEGAAHFAQLRSGVKNQMMTLRNSPANDISGLYFNPVILSRESNFFSVKGLADSVAYDENGVMRTESGDGACGENALVNPDGPTISQVFNETYTRFINEGLGNAYLDIWSGGESNVVRNFGPTGYLGLSTDPQAYLRGVNRIHQVVKNALESNPATSGGNNVVYSEYPNEFINQDVESRYWRGEILLVDTVVPATSHQAIALKAPVYEFVYGDSSVMSSWETMASPATLLLHVLGRQMTYITLVLSLAEVPDALSRFLDAVGLYSRLRVHPDALPYTYGVAQDAPDFSTPTLPMSVAQNAAMPVYSKYAPNSIPIVNPLVVKSEEGGLGVFLFNATGPTPPEQPVSSATINVEISRDNYGLSQQTYNIVEVTENGKVQLGTVDFSTQATFVLSTQVSELQTRLYAFEPLNPISPTPALGIEKKIKKSKGVLELTISGGENCNQVGVFVGSKRSHIENLKGSAQLLVSLSGKTSIQYKARRLKRFTPKKRKKKVLIGVFCDGKYEASVNISGLKKLRSSRSTRTISGFKAYARMLRKKLKAVNPSDTPRQ